MMLNQLNLPWKKKSKPEPLKDIEKESNEIDELLEDDFEEEPKSLNLG